MGKGDRIHIHWVTFIVRKLLLFCVNPKCKAWAPKSKFDNQGFFSLKKLEVQWS